MKCQASRGWLLLCVFVCLGIAVLAAPAQGDVVPFSVVRIHVDAVDAPPFGDDVQENYYNSLLLDTPAFDATSVALRIKNSGADGANLILTSDGGVAVANALKQQGVPMKALVLAGFSDPRVIAQAPAALEGAIGSTFGTVPTSVPGRPGVRTFANGMRAAGLNPDTVSGPIGFVSADTFIKGLTLAGKCPTRAGFIDNLRKQTKITGAGLLPEPISYAPGVTPNGDPARCGWYLVVKDGKFVPDAKGTCGKLVETATGKVVVQ